MVICHLCHVSGRAFAWLCDVHDCLKDRYPQSFGGTRALKKKMDRSTTTSYLFYVWFLLCFRNSLGPNRVVFVLVIRERGLRFAVCKLLLLLQWSLTRLYVATIITIRRSFAAVFSAGAKPPRRQNIGHGEKCGPMKLRLQRCEDCVVGCSRKASARLPNKTVQTGLEQVEVW